MVTGHLVRVSAMRRLATFVSVAALMPAAACATTTTTNDRSIAEDDYRISVEIPLEEAEFEDDQILRVDELLDERTEFDPGDFQLDEVVLIARSEGVPGSPDAAGHAELLVLEWRSGRFDIPAGDAGDWYEIRIPAPDEDPGGAWLLDLSGDVTLDFLVLVMEPRPRVVAEKTVDRTRTVYRTVGGYHRPYPAYWIYDPTRYYVYHYYDDLWPYRYFAGVWDFRYYHVGFRPRYHRFGHYLGPRYDHVHWRDRYRPDRRRYRHGRDPNAWRLVDAGERRPRARYDALKRNNVRLRTFHTEAATPPVAGQSPPRADDSRATYEQAKRTHPRLRQFHRGSAADDPGERDSAKASAVRDRDVGASGRPRTGSVRAAPVRRAAGTVAVPGDGGLGNDYGASRRGSPRQAASEAPRRIPTLRNSAPLSRPATVGNARTRPAATSRSSPSARSASPRQTRGVAPRGVRSSRTTAPAARVQPTVRRAASGNIRSRTFQQRPSAASRPVPVTRSPVRPSSRASTRTPTIQRPAPTRPAAQSSPRVQRSGSARSPRSSNPRREMSR